MTEQELNELNRLTKRIMRGQKVSMRQLNRAFELKRKRDNERHLTGPTLDSNWKRRQK